MPRLRFWGLLLWLLSTPASAFDHVVLISIDGLRADAISKAATPAIQRLLARAIYTLNAHAVIPSYTMPNHTSMLTGLDPQQHGITWNHRRLDSYSEQTIFTILETKGMSTAAFVAKPKLEFLLRAADTAHIEPKPESEQLFTGKSVRNITRLFTTQWDNAPPAFSFIHLREPDSAGHEYEWMSDEYFNAVSLADAAVDKMVENIDASAVAHSTVIIITSDHGGSGNNHAADLPENRTIPWVVILPEAHQAVVIRTSIRSYDTLPTILALLKVEFEEPISGQVPTEVLKAIK